MNQNNPAPLYDRRASWHALSAARAFGPTAMTGATALELVMLAGLLGFYLLIGAMGRDWAEFGIIAGSLWLSIALGVGAYRCAFYAPAGIWSPLFWLRAAIIVYLGFGMIVPFFVNDLTREVIDSFFATSNELGLKSCAITAAGSFIILVFARLLDSQLAPITHVFARPKAEGDLLLLVGLGAAAVGFAFRYFLVLPISFGWIQANLPSSVIQLSMFFPASFFLLGSWCLNNRSSLIWLVFSVAIFDAFVGLLEFSKTEVLLAIIMVGLSLVNAKVTKTRLALVVLTCAAIYAAIIPVVNYGRTVQLERYESITGASLTERIQIIEDYFGPDGEFFDNDEFRREFQGGWARLSYYNQAGFALSLYDTNIPGDSIAQAPIAIIPRAIWPDKPNLNYIGEAFNEAATGSTTSLSWPGIFAEAYWNYGWWGIILIMPMIGLLFGTLSRYAVRVYTQARWIEFPLLLLMMNTAISVMTPIATTLIAGVLLLGLLYVALRTASSMATGSNTGPNWA